MTINEFIRLTRGDRLKMVPSGLPVIAWDISEAGVTVIAPCGARFTVKIDNLELPSDG